MKISISIHSVETSHFNGGKEQSKVVLLRPNFFLKIISLIDHVGEEKEILMQLGVMGETVVHYGF